MGEVPTVASEKSEKWALSGHSNEQDSSSKLATA
jgi:hypothetical protein